MPKVMIIMIWRPRGVMGAPRGICMPRDGNIRPGRAPPAEACHSLREWICHGRWHCVLPWEIRKPKPSADADAAAKVHAEKQLREKKKKLKLIRANKKADGAIIKRFERINKSFKK